MISAQYMDIAIQLIISALTVVMLIQLTRFAKPFDNGMSKLMNFIRDLPRASYAER